MFGRFKVDMSSAHAVGQVWPDEALGKHLTCIDIDPVAPKLESVLSQSSSHLERVTYLAVEMNFLQAAIVGSSFLQGSK